MKNLEITVKDSPIPNAIDQYFSALLELLRPSEKQDIALNSTVVTFDIVKTAPLYTQEVFRAFADRTISVSPTNFEPGAGNIGDRFSERYVDMLNIILLGLDVELKPEDEGKINSHTHTIQELESELSATYLHMTTAWNEYVKSNGIEKKASDYLDKMVAFYNTFDFSTKIRNAKNDILSHYIAIDNIRQKAYPDEEMRELSSIYRFAFDESYKMTRPNEPRLEAVDHYTEVQLAQAWVYGNIGNGSFDIGQEVLPSGDLEYFLDRQGQRSFSISKGFVASETHESHWHTSGSAKWTFFSASVEADHADKWTTMISKANALEISFENLSEYWVRRGQWYNSTIFDFKVVKEYLKKNPLLAARLSYAITSLVIGRGLKITATFSDSNEFNEWTSFAGNSGGGISIFGIGASGNSTYNQSTFEHTVDTVNKTVTFSDSSDNARLLGFRVEKLFDFDSQARASEFLTLEEAQGPRGEQLAKGEISAADLFMRNSQSKSRNAEFMNA